MERSFRHVGEAVVGYAAPGAGGVARRDLDRPVSTTRGCQGTRAGVSWLGKVLDRCPKGPGHQAHRRDTGHGVLPVRRGGGPLRPLYYTVIVDASDRVSESALGKLALAHYDCADLTERIPNRRNTQ